MPSAPVSYQSGQAFSEAAVRVDHALAQYTPRFTAAMTYLKL